MSSYIWVVFKSAEHDEYVAENTVSVKLVLSADSQQLPQLFVFEVKHITVQI